MSIKSDIAEVRGLWSKATVLTRTVLILSLFLTISSVTSIADVVFEWRGFIRTAIDFYRLAIRDPIAGMLSFIRIPADVADIVVTFAVFWGVIMRCNWDFEEAARKPFWRSARALFGLVLVALTGALTRVLPSELRPFATLTLILLILGGCVVASRRERITYFTYVGVVYLVLFVLAAVNEGLTRSAAGP